MGLYDREYLRNTQAYEESYEESVGFGSRADMIAFLKSTYQIFAASLLAASVGAYVGLGIASSVASWYWGFVILEFALLFGLYAVQDKPGINFAVLFAFTFVTGLTLAPLLTSLLALPSGAAIIGQAFFLTSVAFGGISMFALTTKKDFSFMGKFLFISLIIVVVGSIVNIFIGSPMVQLIISMVGAILFSAFILYDTQQVVQGGFRTPIEAAIALYLDFFNLFVSLLQILGIFSSDD